MDITGAKIEELYALQEASSKISRDIGALDKRRERIDQQINEMSKAIREAWPEDEPVLQVGDWLVIKRGFEIVLKRSSDVKSVGPSEAEG